ncbi:MAG: hypothetical protein ACOVP4_08355 [Bacteriovoracaceae bacterium]
MKMTKKLTVFLAALTLSSSMALAKEGGVGNGGGVHWCPNKAPEMYDVYEGKRRFKLDIVDDGTRYEEILGKAIERLKSYNVTLALEIAERMKFLDAGGFSFEDKIKLFLIPDANVLMTDENCEYRQLANWDDVAQRVFVKNEYYEKMDDLNKAALTLHEAIYAVSRTRLNVTNSDSSRRLVGELLASKFKVSENLQSLTKTGDVMIKEGEEGITEKSVSDEHLGSRNRTLQNISLDVHVGAMEINPIKDKIEIVIRAPKIQKMYKELADIGKKLEDNKLRRLKLSRKEKKKLEFRLNEIESYLKSTTLSLNGKELVNGKALVLLTYNQFYIQGIKMRTSSEEEMETIIELRLNSEKNTKTLIYKKDIKLTGTWFSEEGHSFYLFKLNFSQSKF